MKNKTFASVAILSALGLFIPLQSHAFGLGNLELQSALNEPFKAEIEVTALSEEEKDNLQVQLASSEEFDKAGIELSLLLSQLDFNVVERRGRVSIVISSRQAVKEPFLDFLLTASAGSGRLIREYTVLLDPPVDVRRELSSTPIKPSLSSDDVTESSNTTTYNYQTDSNKLSGATYGPTDRNDTLWNIALKSRPNSNISVNQMMLAILRANPNAFSYENINGLKAGYTLTIPGQDTITSLSKAEAIAAVKEQNQLWKNRNSVQTAVAVTDETATLTDTTTESEPDSVIDEADAAVTEQTIQATETEQARLDLVSPAADEAGTDESLSHQGDDQIKQLSEQLTLAQETIEAQAQENIDFKERMAAMEEQLETLRRMVAIKDADLARLQSLNEEPVQNEQMPLAELGSSTEQVQADLEMDMQPAEPNATQSAISEETVESSPSQAATEQNTETEAASESLSETNDDFDLETLTDVDHLVNKAADLLDMDPQQVESFTAKVKQLLNDHKVESMIAALLVLLLLWWIVYRRNRVVTWDEAVEDISDEPVAKATDSVTDEDDNTDDEVETPVSESKPRTKTVTDLVQQADMFVGYADYIQARTSLEQARLQEPENVDVAKKLLFVLYKQNQADAFIDVIADAGLDQHTEGWDEVAQWGHELAPGNILFTTDEAVDEKPESTQVTDTDQVDAEMEQQVDELPAETDDLSFANTTEEPAIEDTQQDEDDAHIEFDLNDYKSEANDEVDSDNEDEPLSFDSSSDLAETVDSVEPITLDISDDNDQEIDSADFDSESDNLNLDIEPISLDLDIDDTDDSQDIELDVTDVTSEQELEAVSDDSTNENELEFDIGDLDDIDEAETKLDLAAAYIDMGDPDGARNILQEVLKEGSDEQQTRAQSLLDSL